MRLIREQVYTNRKKARVAILIAGMVEFIVETKQDKGAH